MDLKRKPPGRDSLLNDEEGLALEAVLVDGATKYEEWEGHRLANRWEAQPDEAVPSEGFMSTMGGMLFGRHPRRKDDNAARKD